MTYEEAIESVFTLEEVKAEIEDHDCEGFELFLEEIGIKDEYTGQEVLDWLGY